MKGKAFTLLELLVVITVIGILSSIVIVSMSGSTDSATIAKGKAYAQQVHALLGANAVGIWNFDEGEGDTVYDVSGYSNDGALEGDTHFVDSEIEGYALSFDGTGDYVVLTNDPASGLSEITIGAWIKPIQLQYGSIYGGWNNSDYNERSSVLFYRGGDGANQDEMTFSIYNSYDNVFTAVGISKLGTDKWYYVVGIYDGSFVKIYVNGELDGSLEATGSINSVTTPVKIGTHKTNEYFFKGYIDEVHVYTEALPATEIRKHYVQGLEKLLASQAITQSEYDQRMEEFNQSLASKRF
jgi:prepilin-type N-terminal cleavage/methylation domain-containing protein